MQPPINDETLVAYLDGELPREEHVHVDQHLQSSADLRQRVSALRASWELLGDLPNLEPRRDLAQSTIEIVTMAIEKESRGWKAWLWSNPWIALGLGGLLMLAAGAASARAVSDYMTRKLLANLPTIVDFPALQYIDTVEFLQALSQVDNLGAAASTNLARTIVGDGKVPLEIAERKHWVENLPEDSRGRLKNHLTDYRLLTDDQRKTALHEITEEIVNNSADTTRYLNTIRAYRALVEAWGEKAKIDLLRMPIDKRIEAIEARVAEILVLNHVPTVADRLAFRDWLDAILDKEENLEQLYITGDIISDLLYGDPDAYIVTEEDLDDLNHRLSPTTANLLANIVDVQTRRRHLGLWIESRVPSERPTGLKDLQENFYSRSEQVKNELEFLPEAEVRKRLRQTVGAAPNGIPRP